MREHCPLCMVTLASEHDTWSAHAERCHEHEIRQRLKNPADPVIPLLRALGALAFLRPFGTPGSYCPECKHRWEYHTKRPNGADTCRIHGCACRDVV